ncbi:MAG: hypothetical protein IKB98_01905 [Clostridia bacterium]|nr:hypothetical protein [Clostridia bacterium]
MATKRDLLLHIKHDIEDMYETGRLGNLTPCEANTILDIYSNYLIMNKAGETIQKAVANWYRKYNFIVVSEVGIGWRIAFKQIKNATI